MFYLCCVRKEIKMLIECLSSEEYWKIFHTERNHVSLCDVWVRIRLYETKSLSPCGKLNLNRIPFLSENNKGFLFQFFAFLFVILWGATWQRGNIAFSICAGFTPSSKMKVGLRRWRVRKMGKFECEVFRMSKASLSSENGKVSNE